jgi:hypothetical protein
MEYLRFKASLALGLLNPLEYDAGLNPIQSGFFFKRLKTERGFL